MALAEKISDASSPNGELGAAPSGWELVRFGDYYDFQNGVNADASAYGSGVPFANVLEVITHSHLTVAEIPGLVDLPRETVRAFELRHGDVLFNRTSETQDEVGLTSVYADNAETVFGGFVIRGRPKNGAFDLTYAGYAFRSPFVRRQIISKGQGVVRANIGQADLRSVYVFKPPLQEQRSIADALSDADALIESLETLVVKKRAIKRGAMQRLLAPQPGRIACRMGDAAQLKARIGWQGLTTAEYLDSGEYHLVTGTEFNNGFIDWDNCPFVTRQRYDQDKYIQLRENDVLVTKDGTIGKIAFIDKLPKPATLNSGVFVIRPLSTAIRPKFLYYLLMSEVFDDFLNKLSAGSTISHLYQKDFVGFSFLVPSTEDEQDKIADSLTEMDSDIQAVESRLAKARQIKQGMMQELLTGRVRLV